MNMNKGVSIVICCYNSSKLLPETIRHISLLKIPAGISCEIIVVDNNSNDNTSETAEELLKKYISGNVTYKILFQPVQGLSAARKMGFENSAYEYIIFCDDDNWLNADYIEILINTMRKSEKIGAVGGESTAVSDEVFPWWFQEFSQSYSAGKQSESDGIISGEKAALWGAGMAVRRSALKELYSNGFRSILSDRKKKELSSGGDIELCYALRLAGWEIWYESSLKIRHFIPGHRLKWDYLRKLSRGFGAQKVNLDPYFISNQNSSDRNSQKWRYQAFRFMKKLRGYGFTKLVRFKNYPEGDPEILRIEKTIGRLTEILKIRGEYDKRIKSVREASWRNNDQIKKS